MGQVGYIAHPTLAGEQLVGVSPTAVKITHEQGVMLHRMATGRFRKTVHFKGLGFPDVQKIYSFRIQYDRLTTLEDSSLDRELYLDMVDWLISRPGLETFTNWKHVRLSWTVTAGQSEFFLPWRLAPYFVSLPTEDPLGLRSKPVVSTSFIDKAARLTVIEKTTAEYDSETPGAGEVFIDTEGTRFTVGDSLATGSVLYGSMVPLFNVFLSVEGSRDMRTNKEGRVLLLQGV